MPIIGYDYHPGFQQIAFVDTETGECGERRPTHREEAEQFYGALKGRSVRVWMEASGHARWFERLLIGLQFKLWIGDAAGIRTKRVRNQKTDRHDARLCCDCSSKTAFHESGYRTQRIVICGNLQRRDISGMQIAIGPAT
jgi:hypothetical protein